MIEWQVLHFNVLSNRSLQLGYLNKIYKKYFKWYSINKSVKISPDEPKSSQSNGWVPLLVSNWLHVSKISHLF